MTVKSGHIPFPSIECPLEGFTPRRDGTPLSSPIERSKSYTSLPTNQESHVTATSSKLTSSDKLSALPAPGGLTDLNHPYTRPRTSALSTHSTRHEFRRSLDASTSFPSLMASEHEPRSTKRGFSQTLARRLEASLGTGTRDDESVGRETPKQRVSFDSERHSAPAQSMSRAFSWVRSSDPTPPVRRTPVEQHRNPDHLPHDQPHHSRSASHSRGTSPLRFLHQISSSLHHLGTHFEEPFVPVNPYQYKSSFPFCFLPQHQQDLEADGSMSSGAYDCEDVLPINTVKSILQDCRAFMTDTLPRELYLNLLLRLPAMYFSRVARIFEDAEVSRPDIQRIIDSSRAGGTRASALLNAQIDAAKRHQPVSSQGVFSTTTAAAAAANVGVVAATAMLNTPLPFPDEWTPGSVPIALIRFKHSWEAFIDSLVREWKTLNVVSALLASAILTMFQIPQTADDPVTRTGALMSLMCALLSLTYGCMYIVRFGQMRSMFHASRWAEQAGKTKTLIWWNVWVLLAMPAIWLAWAMLWFMAAILSFVWRTGSVNDPDDRPPLGEIPALITRILITSVLALGMVYLILIIRTLKKYGSHQGSARSLLRSGVNRDANVNEGGNAEQMNRGRDASPRKKGGAATAEMADTQRRGRVMDRHALVQYPSRGRQEKVEPNRRPGGLKGLFGSSSPAKNEEKRVEVEVEMDIKVKQDVDVVVNDLTK